MTFSSPSKPRLVELVKELAVVHGRVTLSSGLEADYYVDLRRATLHHEAAPLIGQVILDLLDANGVTDFDAIGGLTMGADPVATSVLHQGAARGRAIDAFVVRKIPVLPEVASTIAPPGCSSPEASAASTIAIPMRSLTDDEGL